MARKRLSATMSPPQYRRHGEEVACGYDTLLDPYGTNGPEEFFAVASESFFEQGEDMARVHPRLYALLAGYYGLQTRHWQSGLLS